MKLTTNQRTQLKQLFNGIIWEGLLISKSDRDFLLKAKMIDKVRGFNVITKKGINWYLDYLIESSSKIER